MLRPEIDPPMHRDQNMWGKFHKFVGGLVVILLKPSGQKHAFRKKKQECSIPSATTYFFIDKYLSTIGMS